VAKVRNEEKELPSLRTPNMNEIKALQLLIERLETAVAQGRGVLKDLRAAKQELVQFIDEEAGKVIERSAKAQVDEMGKVLKGKMDSSVAHIDEGFRHLQDLYMGRADQPAGKPTIEDMTSFAKVVDYFKREGRFPDYG
jgi:hypothetical protein